MRQRNTSGKSKMFFYDFFQLENDEHIWRRLAIFLVITLVAFFFSGNFAGCFAIWRAQRRIEPERHVPSDDSSCLMITSKEIEIMLRQGFFNFSGVILPKLKKRNILKSEKRETRPNENLRGLLQIRRKPYPNPNPYINPHPIPHLNQCFVIRHCSRLYAFLTV